MLLLAAAPLAAGAGSDGSGARYRPAPELLRADPGRSFEAYVEAARRHVSAHKVAVPGFERGRQVAWSLPFERLPPDSCKGPEKGLLLIHGLADTPFVFRDLADALAARCVRVRAILLPGHGTRPGDLVVAESDAWFAMARSHAARLAEEVDELYVGGHSMGGAIATVLALEDPRVRGLLAIAPSWELTDLRRVLWLATLAEPFIDFLEHEPEINPIKYETLAVNTGDEIGEVRERVQVALRHRGPLRVPTLLAATAADSVIDLDYLQRTFRERVTHPDSRLLVYRDTRAPRPAWWDPARMREFDAYQPEKRILEMSHQSLPIAPDNPLYGRGGALQHCLEPNGTTRSECLAAPREQVWYGAYHDRSPPERIVSRLTWNPHFTALVDQAARVLGVGRLRTAERTPRD